MGLYFLYPEIGGFMKIKRIIMVVLIVVVLLVVVLNCFSSVGTTERGIMVTFGKAGQEVSEPGIHFTIPFAQTIRKYSLAPVNYEIEFSIGSDGAVTSDMQTIGLTADVFWIYDETRLYDAATKYTESSLRNAIEKTMLASVKESVGRYTIYQIVEQQEKISGEISESLKSKMKDYPIVITQIAISNWDWSPAFDEQIAETMKTTQQVKIAEQELQITEQEAQKQIKEAAAEQEAMVIRANAEKEKAMIEAQTALEVAQLQAEAKKVEADALAYYNQKVAENLEVELELKKLEVEKARVEKWNGQYVSTYQYGPIPVTQDSLLGTGTTSTVPEN